MSAVLAVEPRRATPAEQPALSASLAAAFADDPVFGWLLPHERSRLRRLRRFFDLELRHMGFARGTVWTCGDHAGAVLCMPPGKWQMPPATTLGHAGGFLRTFGRRLPIAGALQGAMEFRHPRIPHWYILAIGVRPEHQGRGLGSALMRPTLEECDRDGLPAYLEASSERSAALYERLGFEHIRELRLGSGPPLWLMLRPPAKG